ncbi:MAG TPA: response regulator [Anaerolineae bacterium]|nr:response regulator [Anaerolineae bacterium]
MGGKNKGRVLIAEDDALVCELVAALVEHQGYQVVGTARDGCEAVEAVVQLRPDVVVMDLEMPEMNGIEATRRIQQTCPTPVVALTAHDDLGLAAKAARVGVGAYLVKPPIGRDLARAIIVAQVRFAEDLAIREVNADLAAQNRDLEGFAHTVAHDLRNALAPIVGTASLLSEDLDTISSEQARRQVEVIAGQGAKMRRMIDDLLMLAQVRDAQLVVRPLDMHALLEDAWSRLAPLAESLDGRLSGPEAWPDALGYGPWVVEVWVNYLSNALKYGGRPPEVQAGWDARGTEGKNAVRFWIQDNGGGLTAEEQSQLFRPFVQLNSARSDGYGLGLSIARRIVEKLGGEVGVESQVGQGSTFWFTLPAA